MVSKAIIVAAGLSSRLYPLTRNKPKSLLEVNGKSLIERSIQILKNNGIEDIAIIVGYKGNMIKDIIEKEEVSYISNPFYNKCNNMGSLWFAKDFIGESPFIYLHGDVIYHPDILSQKLLSWNSSEYDMELIVDFGPTDMEAMKVQVDQSNCLVDSSKKISSENSAGEWTGIAFIKCSKMLFIEIESLLMKGHLEEYDTHAFSNLAKKGYKLHCVHTNGLPWVEIDFYEDLNIASRLFENG